MPNRLAKKRKSDKRLKNKQLKKTGRTPSQIARKKRKLEGR